MADKRSSILRLTPEAKVGLFVLLGIIILVYMSLRVGGIQLGRAEGYTLHVYFNSAAGLDPDAAVRVAGVEVGRVKEIELDRNQAHLTLRIKPDVEIGRDFTAVLTTKGLLGERYLELMPGSPNAPILGDGDELTRTTSYADMDKLITILSDVSGDIKTVTSTLSNVFGGVEGEATLKNILANVEDISYRLSSLVEKNDERMGRIMVNLDEFTTLLKEEGPALTRELRVAAESLSGSVTRTSDNLNSLIEDNRDDINRGVKSLRVASMRLQETMEGLNDMVEEVSPQVRDTVRSVSSVAGKIDRGEGSIGKLVNDPRTVDNLNKTVEGVNRFLEKAESFRTFIGYRPEYLLDASDTKSYFSLKIQPKADKYYLLEVVDDPRGQVFEETREVTTNGGVPTVTEEVRTEDEFKFTVQFAKRFWDFTFRGGLIESAGGVAVDYHAFDDHLKFTLEAFDFSEDEDPHMKASANIYLNKFFYFVAGYDDFLSDKGLESAFVGLGFQFEDEDLKYLFSSAPPVSF